MLLTPASVGDAPAPCKETSGGYLGGNALGDSLVTFSSGRKSPCGAHPGGASKSWRISVPLYCATFPLTLSVSDGIMSITTKQKQTKRAGKGHWPTEGVTLSGSPDTRGEDCTWM